MSTYDDIAGFDTSSLGLGAAALQGGQAGIDVANAAFANLSGAARYASAVALIEAAAGDGGVSPVRALLAFVDRLNQLDGDSSHFTAIGAEIAGLVASGSLDAAAAMADFLPAINAYQIGRSEAASIFIAVCSYCHAAAVWIVLRVSRSFDSRWRLQPMFHHLRDCSGLGFGFGRVHPPNYTQNGKTREEKVRSASFSPLPGYDRLKP